MRQEEAATGKVAASGATGASLTQCEYTAAASNPLQLHTLYCDRKHCGCLPRWRRCPARDWLAVQR